MRILFLYIFLGFAATLYILGYDNLSFTNYYWLTSSNDMTSDLISWKYYKDDIWRFPIGSNPNYGMDIASGIVFSGSVPFLSVIFKLFGNFLPNDFHFFGFWIFICFFLQSYIAFLIIYHHTKNISFSIIGSLFFLVSPIFVHRIPMHLSLSAHWLILLGFYIETKNETAKKLFCWIGLILLSALTHFYFTIILLGIFFLFVLNEHLVNLNVKKLVIQICLPLIFLFMTMYIFGFFEVPYTDAPGYGYGYYKLNLTSIINPISESPSNTVNWSLFLPEIPSHLKERIEGFNYLGIGGIFLLIIGIFFIFFNFTEFKKKKYRPYFFIIILFPLIALTNRISFANNLLFEFELPKYIYGMMSLVRASGRLFWPVYYLFFLGSIIILYNKFTKKNSLNILMLLFFLQVIDISPGLKNYFNSNAFKIEKKEIDYLFWNKLSQENQILRTTYLNNETHFLKSLKEILLSQNFTSTDIAKHARYNRKKASTSRTNLYKSFDEGTFKKNTIFVIDNNNHLRNLKYLFENKNVGFFFKDNAWVFVPNKKNEMTDFDKKELSKYDPLTLQKKGKIILKFNDDQSVHGFGWSHNFLSSYAGIWTEGNISTLLFKFNEKINKDYSIKIKLASLITKKNKPINFSINFNDLFTEKFSLKNINELEENSIKLKINRELISDGIHYIKFQIDNPVSPLELFQSPDARKLGLLVESIEILAY
jgi:hypothetical protein